MNPTPLDYIYIWESLFLIPLQSGGQAADMKTQREYIKCANREQVHHLWYLMSLTIQSYTML